MNIKDISIQELKKLRPDIYQAIKQEVCLNELRLTKDDIISMIEPLSENIKEHLYPYLSKLSAMTHNDIVDMEEDACNLYLHIATLEDLKKHRPDLCDLLYNEYYRTPSVNTPPKPDGLKKKKVITDNGVKKGDAIRWNYNKEEGIVVGFKNEDGTSYINVQRFNGTKVLFENDPKLFTILEGEEKANVISERKKYIAESKERKDLERAFISKKRKKAKTISDGIVYNEPTRRGSKLKVGDHIRFKKTKEVGIVKGFMRIGGWDRILMGESKGIPKTIIDNPEAYEILTNHRESRKVGK